MNYVYNAQSGFKIAWMRDPQAAAVNVSGAARSARATPGSEYDVPAWSDALEALRRARCRQGGVAPINRHIGSRQSMLTARTSTAPALSAIGRNRAPATTRSAMS